MIMDNSIWLKMHGGTTHFPIALVMASVAFDLAAVIVPENADGTRRAGFRAAGYYTLLLAAMGAIGAVISGLVMTHGQIWGRGNLAHHHAFLWPAFGMVVALAGWRLVVGGRASHAAFRIYLTASIVTGGLMAAAGYWGGELLLNG
jgi:uncharacterized membrane protein